MSYWNCKIKASWKVFLFRSHKMVILKYEIHKFSISFSKNLAKTKRIIHTNLENRIKTLEQNLKNKEDFNVYNLCKLELKNIYDRKAEGTKICSKCEWYQDGEKLTKFFLNLEKQRAINTTVRHLIDDAKGQGVHASWKTWKCSGIFFLSWNLSWNLPFSEFCPGNVLEFFCCSSQFF